MAFIHGLAVGAANNCENVPKALDVSSTEIEVVVHGKALGMLLKTNKGQQERIRRLADESVGFGACEDTMQRQGKCDLFAFVMLDSWIAEWVQQQKSGWAYIKAGHKMMLNRRQVCCRLSEREK